VKTVRVRLKKYVSSSSISFTKIIFLAYALER